MTKVPDWPATSRRRVMTRLEARKLPDEPMVRFPARSYEYTRERLGSAGRYWKRAVGKVVLSMLLARYPKIGKIYALIRPGVSVPERAGSEAPATTPRPAVPRSPRTGGLVLEGDAAAEE